MTHADQIAAQLKVAVRQVSATIELLDAGNTLPFIARYRKEVTEGLDEEQIRVLEERLGELRALDERRETILVSIETQGKLTPELREQIMAVTTRTELEDLYLPYKPKRRTRASIAREKGLQGLADLIIQQAVSQKTLTQLVEPFLNEQVLTPEDALSGARDIVAETISDHAEVRRLTRDKAMRWGGLVVEKVEDAQDPKRVYETYYQFECRVDLLRPHQALAINRGETEKVLRVKLNVQERDWREAMASSFRISSRSVFGAQMELLSLIHI
jgi:uncharacterized protein